MLRLHDGRRCKCSEHRGDEPWHGASSGYANHYCRCDRCREWQARRNRRHVQAYEDANRELVRQRQRLYRERNGHAARERVRVATERHKTLPAERRGEPWSRSEDASVLRTDLRLIDLAAMLGRSVSGIENRRRKLRAAASQA